MTRSSASIRTSEPAFRPHTSQWQRENMGRVEPMPQAEPEWVRGGRLLFTGLAIIFAVYAVAVFATRWAL
jgi:hypothetical protein